MLKEFVEAIREMAVEGCTESKTPVMVPVNPRTAYATLEGDKVVINEAEREPARCHKSIDLETITAFAVRFKETAAIWYSRFAVIVLTDDADREDSVRLNLQFSDQYRKLMDLAKSQAKMSQRDTILMLRSTFKDGLLNNADLVKQLRSVKVQSSGGAELQRGKSSEGRQIAAQIGSEYEPPEYLSLSIPVFLDQIGTGLQTVQCVFEVDENGPAFQLFPLPAELEKAAVEAERMIQANIIKLLGKEKVPVYYGTP